MAQEIEAAALDSVQAVLGRDASKHGFTAGAPCPNCATPLAGPWCHACGQSSDDHHRSLLKLTGEAIGGLVDIDSRLWRTLPDLCLRPARLTRSYLDGHRVSQIPPFRLFLVVIVLVFLAASLEPSRSGPAPLGPGAAIAAEPQVNLDFNINGKQVADAWLTARLKTIAKNPQRFETALVDWAQRLAVLALPMSAALLGLMFFWRKGVYLFDHLIFSMHSLSFQGLLLSVAMLASRLNGVCDLLLLIAPAHLFAHLKGVYRVGTFGTLARMLVLFIGSAFGFLLAFAGLVMIGLYEIGA
jgi:hypothetical protein